MASSKGPIGRHYDILGWIERVGVWGTLGLWWDLDNPPERTPGTVVTPTHDMACGRHVPGVRLRKRAGTVSDAMLAQQEVRESPELAAEIEARWRKHSRK